MLRRLLTLALLIAFGSPFVAPIFAATSDAQSNLPACCRRHGKHHCVMPGGAQNNFAGPAFEAPPCPFYPAPIRQSGIADASLAAPLGPSVQVHRAFEPLAPSQRGVQIAAASAHLKRGPPSRPA